MANNQRRSVRKPAKKNFFQRVPLPVWIGGGVVLVALIVILCVVSAPKKDEQKKQNGSDYAPIRCIPWVWWQ